MGRRGARLVFWFPSPMKGEGLGVRVFAIPSKTQLKKYF